MLGRIGASLDYAAGMRNLLRSTVGPLEAQAIIRAAVATREQAFVSMLERAVYAVPASPYKRLLDHAGIGVDDAKALVRDHGIEGTLRRLYDAGIYIRPDEFRGKAPVRRGGLEFPVTATDFDNPLTRSQIEVRSTGTRGAPIRVLMDFDMIAHEASQFSAVLEAHGIEKAPIAIWRPVLQSGLKITFRYAKTGRMPVRWFTQHRFRLTGGDLREAYVFGLTRLVARVQGRPLPRREVVPRGEVLQVVRWLAEQARRGQPALLETNTSPAIRVCLAAREQGIDISGSIFHVVGEPYTLAKAEVVASVGARAINRYAMTELSLTALGCARGATVDDLHLLSDKVALIQQPKAVAASGSTVDSLVFTTLLPGIPKLMLNVETDDYATVTERDCGCLLGELGLTTHLSGVRSYGKLTSEGVTFLGSELYRLLEEVLPSRFGGGPGDYQLIEEEENGLPRVSLLIRPSIGQMDEAAVLHTLYEALAAYPSGGAIMAAEWRQADTLRVQRRDPIETGSAKILPLHVLQGTQSSPRSDVVSPPVA